MANPQLFSEKFSQCYLSQNVLNEVILLFKKYHVQSWQVDEISKDLLVFIKRYYANGEHAKQDTFNVNRVLQLLMLRKEIWELAEEEVMKYAYPISPDFLTQKQQEEDIIETVCKRVLPGKNYVKLTENMLKDFLINPLNVQLSFTKKHVLRKQKIKAKAKQKKFYNIASKLSFSFPFGSNAQTTVTSRTNPYKILMIEDYLCRGMYRGYSPFIFTGMIN